MRNKTKACIIAIPALLMLSFALSIAFAAGSITLTPTAQAPGASVSVAGTGFGATKTVAIGVGSEVAGNEANMAYSGTGMGPYSGRVSNYPIKPSSFILTSDTTSGAGLVSTYTDNGDGTTTGSFEGATGTINYVTGQWSRSTTVDVSGIATNYSATYTRYQYNVTSAAGVTTNSSGGFTTPITVPAGLANGNYIVTAIDASGNRATATLSVNSAIPETTTISVLMLLSSVSVIVGLRYFRKQVRIKN